MVTIDTFSVQIKKKTSTYLLYNTLGIGTGLFKSIE